MNTKGKRLHFWQAVCTVLGILLLSGCGYHYKCGVTFGASTCTPSNPGIGTGNGASAAYGYNIVSTGTINGFSLTAGTSPTVQDISGFTAPTVPVSDDVSEIVIAQKKFVYAAFPHSQLLFAFSINSSGGLTALANSPYTIASLGNIVVPSILVNMKSIAVNPSGTLLFIAGASLGAVDVYQISSTGALTQVSGAPFSTGTVQPWNVWFDGTGKYLYVTNGPEGLQQNVGAFSIGSSGALTVVPGSPFAYNMWQLQGDPSGNYMIGITGKSSALNGLGNDANLYLFSIQQSGANAGALTQVSGSPFPTVSAPVNLAVQPLASNGSFVYSFSGTPLLPDPIEGYELDTTNGTLTALTTSPFGGLGTGFWGQFDQSGSHLFIFANTASASSLGILTATSGTGDLSENISILPLDSSTYFAVTDVP
jgi:hypothetical protein